MLVAEIFYESLLKIVEADLSDKEIITFNRGNLRIKIDFKSEKITIIDRSVGRLFDELYFDPSTCVIKDDMFYISNADPCVRIALLP